MILHCAHKSSNFSLPLAGVWRSVLMFLCCDVMRSCVNGVCFATLCISHLYCFYFPFFTCFFPLLPCRTNPCILDLYEVLLLMTSLNHFRIVSPVLSTVTRQVHTNAYHYLKTFSETTITPRCCCQAKKNKQYKKKHQNLRTNDKKDIYVYLFNVVAYLCRIYDDLTANYFSKWIFHVERCGNRFICNFHIIKVEITLS